ncbi:MAG: hypothetical protein ABIN05_01765 [candidate division WOR-3 bacterium]
MKGYFLNYSAFDVYTNMAIDEWAYKNIDTIFFRFYSFSKPSITIGYNQRYNVGIDYDYVIKEKIDITRRITGGRAVLHSGDLTYSFVGKIEHFGKNYGLLDRYKRIAEIFIKGFKELKIDAELTQGEKKENFIANCFGSQSVYEISYKGEKIVGSAQTFSETNFLQQGTILVKESIVPQEKIYGKNFSNNIENLTGLTYNIENISSVFYKIFFRELDFEWEEVELDFEDEKLQNLIQKYKDEEWIKKR